MKFASLRLLFFAFLIFAFSCSEETQKADLIISNGKIWTGNDQQPWAEAMAVSSDSILAVGTNEEIQKLRGQKHESKS